MPSSLWSRKLFKPLLERFRIVELIFQFGNPAFKGFRSLFLGVSLRIRVLLKTVLDLDCNTLVIVELVEYFLELRILSRSYVSLK